MLITTVIICIGLAIAAKDLPGLYRKHRFKDMFVYIIMLGIGTWLSVLAAKSEVTPSPLVLIEIIYNPVNAFVSHVFGF
ncbi:hypothetical protein ACT3XG_03965 [Paenibacillus polymyxa]|uniref:Uncharacterized protein n=1 Tax=Paenibacillus polymyxa TaxID=1406 RepID=A0A0F0FY97_PAEPO|nr:MULTISPECIES: hypothetical protein [Paenibacillus]AHM64459.1 hypothetical protein PPSQR21_007960 [Paenibacillus polymyxa SQR-21]AIY10116.1 hypothetical protein LK13_16910 [Paenibacillus polymyxa]AJE50990.1 hypothetical protein RE92_07875 [Paenibacillus polymyxa]AUS25025.1 hypothetical protein C1A50_0837 [Paenibacillus polymyxa]KAE8561488.1 hypothetical protein BJH92_03585 [Paenibacillus polymyxa]